MQKRRSNQIKLRQECQILHNKWHSQNNPKQQQENVPERLLYFDKGPKTCRKVTEGKPHLEIGPELSPLEVDFDEKQSFIVDALHGLEYPPATESLLQDKIVRRRQVLQVIL